MDALLGVDRQKDTLLANFRRFASGLPFNHAMLWGVRGTGKSSLAKAAFMACAEGRRDLKLVEVDRDEITALPRLFDLLRGRPERFVVLCDDLSFEDGAEAAKALKSALEGGVSGPPPNVLFLATSNRRHLMQRDMIENERATAIHPGEAIEERRLPEGGGGALPAGGEMPARADPAACVPPQGVGIGAGPEPGKDRQPVDRRADPVLPLGVVVHGRMVRRLGQEPRWLEAPAAHRGATNPLEGHDVVVSGRVGDDVRLPLLPEHCTESAERFPGADEPVVEMRARLPLRRRRTPPGDVHESHRHVERLDHRAVHQLGLGDLRRRRRGA